MSRLCTSGFDAHTGFLYYHRRMTASKLPRPPDAPIVTNRRALTPTEEWYRDCLRIWSDHHGRAPTIIELASYVDRSHTPVWQAMRALVAKGYVRQNGERRYEVIP